MTAGSLRKPADRAFWDLVGRGYCASIRVVLGATLLWSGCAKVFQPYDFLDDVYAYRLTGPLAGLIVAMALPWFEILLGLCLLLALRMTSMFLFSTILMVVFVLVQFSALDRGLQIDCGCFGNVLGDAHDHIDTSSLGRTAVLAANAGFACVVSVVLRRNQDLVESKSVMTS